jgi:gliding motility-associated transport system ATP-binding protein
VCNRAIIIARGRILADAPPGELAARSRHHNAVRLGVPPGAEPGIAAELKGLASVATVEMQSEGELVAFPRGGKPIADAVADLARARGWPVRSLEVERGRLDEVFREVTAPPLPEAA